MNIIAQKVLRKSYRRYQTLYIYIIFYLETLIKPNQISFIGRNMEWE